MKGLSDDSQIFPKKKIRSLLMVKPNGCQGDDECYGVGHGTPCYVEGIYEFVPGK